jgi:hypothetical protein
MVEAQEGPGAASGRDSMAFRHIGEPNAGQVSLTGCLSAESPLVHASTANSTDG